MPRDSASAIQTMFIDRGISVVFAGEEEKARVVFGFVRHLDRPQHAGDHVDRVVLERNDALGTGAHADSATPAAILVELGRALLVFVDGAEGALLGASFTGGATLQEEAGEGKIAGARVDSLSAGS